MTSAPMKVIQSIIIKAMSAPHQYKYRRAWKKYHMST